MKKKFLLGDKIVMTGTSGNYRVGDKGVVLAVDNSRYNGGMTCYVKFSTGSKQWVVDENIQLLVDPAPVPFKSLTLEEVEQVFNSLPGGLEGFCKGWGWYDFARGIELLSKQKNGGRLEN